VRIHIRVTARIACWKPSILLDEGASRAGSPICARMRKTVLLHALICRNPVL
jgi:hypothetical protein